MFPDDDIRETIINYADGAGEENTVSETNFGDSFHNTETLPLNSKTHQFGKKWKIFTTHKQEILKIMWHKIYFIFNIGDKKFV